MSREKIYQQVKEILDEALRKGQSLDSEELRKKNALDAITRSKELLASLDNMGDKK